MVKIRIVKFPISPFLISKKDRSKKLATTKIYSLSSSFLKIKNKNKKNEKRAKKLTALLNVFLNFNVFYPRQIKVSSILTISDISH